MAGDEAVLRVLLEGAGGVSPESPAGARPTQPAREQQPRQTRPEPAGRPARRPESLLNTLIDIAGRFRGTLGGMFGPLAGAALDAAKAIRDMQQASAEAARAIRERNKPDALPGKPDIGRAPDEARRAAMRQALGLKPPIGTELLPPPGVRPNFDLGPPRAKKPEFVGPPKPEFVGPPKPPMGVGSQPQPLTAAETARLRDLRRATFGKQEKDELAELESRAAPRPYDPTRAEPPPAEPLIRKRQDQTASPVEDALPMAEGGGLAALAGPAAVVIAVVEAAKLLKAGVMAAVSAAGDLAKGLTAPEVSAASFAEGIGGAAKKASDALIFVAPPLAILAGAAGQAAESLGGLMRNLDSMANRYTGFAPGVAQAQAFATIQHVAGEFRRGREIGDSLSRYVIARTELQEKFEDVKANFIKEVTPAVLMAMSFLERLLPFVELAGDDLAGIITLLTLILQPLTAIKDYFVTQKKPVKITDLSKPFLDALRNMQFAPGQGQ